MQGRQHRLSLVQSNKSQASPDKKIRFIQEEIKKRSAAGRLETLKHSVSPSTERDQVSIEGFFRCFGCSTPTNYMIQIARMEIQKQRSHYAREQFKYVRIPFLLQQLSLTFDISRSTLRLTDGSDGFRPSASISS